MLSHDKNHSGGVFPLWYADFGGISWSVDGISWTPPDAGRNAYNTAVDPSLAAGGSKQSNHTLSSRQRPFLFFEFDTVAAGGSGGTFLFNGVGLPGKSHWNFSCTFVQQLDTAGDADTTPGAAAIDTAEPVAAAPSSLLVDSNSRPTAGGPA